MHLGKFKYLNNIVGKIVNYRNIILFLLLVYIRDGDRSVTERDNRFYPTINYVSNT